MPAPHEEVPWTLSNEVIRSPTVFQWDEDPAPYSRPPPGVRVLTTTPARGAGAQGDHFCSNQYNALTAEFLYFNLPDLSLAPWGPGGYHRFASICLFLIARASSSRPSLMKLFLVLNCSWSSTVPGLHLFQVIILLCPVSNLQEQNGTIISIPGQTDKTSSAWNNQLK